MWKKIVTKLPSHWIQLNSTVTKIETEDKRVRFHAYLDEEFVSSFFVLPLQKVARECAE